MQPQFTSQRIVSISKAMILCHGILLSAIVIMPNFFRNRNCRSTTCSCNCTFVPITSVLSKASYLACMFFMDWWFWWVAFVVSTVLCIQLGSLYHEEREREIMMGKSNHTPKHILGFSGQFWWNSLFFCSCKLSKYLQEDTLSISKLHFLIHPFRTENFIFFFFGSCAFNCLVQRLWHQVDE